MQHDNADDISRGYIIFNEDSVVLPSCDAVNGRYVSRVTFDFRHTLQSGADIWLYTFQRNGTTNQFTVIARYQIPSGLIATVSDSDGIQTIDLSFNVLPVAPGQYLGAGFNSKAGICYQSTISGQFYDPTPDTGFATFSTAVFNFRANGCAAITYDVVEY